MHARHDDSFPFNPWIIPDFALGTNRSSTPRRWQHRARVPPLLCRKSIIKCIKPCSLYTYIYTYTCTSHSWFTIYDFLPSPPPHLLCSLIFISRRRFGIQMVIESTRWANRKRVCFSYFFKPRIGNLRLVFTYVCTCPWICWIHTTS